MKIFAWSDEKNRKLQRERDISFELVVTQIEAGKILDILEHPDQKRYPGQKLLVVVKYSPFVGQIFRSTKMVQAASGAC